ncbi:uncharacterized protein UV8b_01657 [Ustilaginoidea virens]|uniref:Uncharacterized protein n=1 Tax=Ustilaginoidea virens TaxID=1159556 RepID=A0A8E5MEK8_USTVR|nr:uncharacterized protein UV8b_01657 [Ustilaginoidea virens]QUC17416.1 hypothetical protein UV8b_01657 [Ustilaginoidea virens]
MRKKNHDYWFLIPRRKLGSAVGRRHVKKPQLSRCLGNETQPRLQCGPSTSSPSEYESAWFITAYFIAHPPKDLSRNSSPTTPESLNNHT